MYKKKKNKPTNVKIFLWGYQPVPFNKKISFFAFSDCKLNRNHKEKVIQFFVYKSSFILRY